MAIRQPFDAIVWWELRRIRFNLWLLAAGAVSFGVILFIGSKLVHPGEDVIEPLALIAFGLIYVVGANVLYTLGWITELLWSGGDTSRTSAQRPSIFRKGIIFSIAVTLAPAMIVPLLWWIFGFQHDC
jgi:hypothetical protein